MRPNPLMPILDHVASDAFSSADSAKAGLAERTMTLHFRPRRSESIRGPIATKRVWFLVVPRTGLLNIAGPWEVLGHANDVLGRTAYELEAARAARAGRPDAARPRRGRAAAAARDPARACRTWRSSRARRSRPLPEVDARLRAWLRRFHARIPTVVSICTGAFVLAAAGVLDGRRATTHWMFLDELRARYPAVRVVDDGIFVKDRGVWTSAGITAGIDLTLALVEEDHGHRVAMAVAKRLVLFLRRSGNQAQFSAGAAAAGEGAAEAARHLDVRPRAPRRAAAGRADRAPASA